jgi:hypothetical protein
LDDRRNPSVFKGLFAFFARRQTASFCTPLQAEKTPWTITGAHFEVPGAVSSGEAWLLSRD